MNRASALLLVVALALRAWNLDFGLVPGDPDASVLGNQVDEQGMVESVLEGLGNADLHPGDFLHRGPGGYLVLLLVDAALVGAWSVTLPGGWDEALARLSEDPVPLHLVHRVVSMVAGVLTVLLVARVARRHLDATSATLAGLFCAVGYLHVRESHFGTVDALWALGTVAVLGAALDLVARPSGRAYLRAGLLAGATAAIKYFGVLLLPALLVAHAQARARARAEGRPRPGGGPLLLGALGVPLGFALLSPFLAFAPADLVAQLGWSSGQIGAAPSPGAIGRALAHHVPITLLAGMGEAIFGLAVVGLVAGLLRPGPTRLIGVLCLVSIPALLVTRHHPVRFGLSLAVLLTLPAGWIVAPLVRGRPGRAALLVPVLVLPGLVRAVSFDRLVGRTDTRQQALATLDELGARREQVVAFGHHGLPRAREPGRRAYVDYYRRLHVAGTIDARALRRDPPRYLLLDETADPGLGWDALSGWVARRYRLHSRFEGRVDPAAAPYPDPEAGTPAFMVPFRAPYPWVVSRPGPPLSLYERIDA